MPGRKDGIGGRKVRGRVSGGRSVGRDALAVGGPIVVDVDMQEGLGRRRPQPREGAANDQEESLPIPAIAKRFPDFLTSREEKED